VNWTRKAIAESEIGEGAREDIQHRNAGAMLARFATVTPREKAAA
jgi:hypothetical protein